MHSPDALAAAACLTIASCSGAGAGSDSSVHHEPMAMPSPSTTPDVGVAISGAGDPAQAADGMSWTVPTSAPPPTASSPPPTVSSDCKLPPPTVLATGPSPSQIAVDSTAVYWSEYEGAPVMSAPIGGGIANTLFDSTYTLVLGIDTTSVFSAGGPLGKSIVTCPKAGCTGAPTVIANGTSTALNLALDAANVYWTAQGEVLKSPKAGGAPITLATGSYPWGLAVDGTNVYWGDQQPKSVMKTPIDGGTATLVANAVNGPGLIAVRGSTLYVSDNPDIFRVEVDGSGQRTLVSGEADNSFGLAVDDTSVYFSSSSKGIVAKAPIGGGPVTILACARTGSTRDGGALQGKPWGLAVDGSSVYWVDSYFGQVLKAPK